MHSAPPLPTYLGLQLPVGEEEGRGGSSSSGAPLKKEDLDLLLLLLLQLRCTLLLLRGCRELHMGLAPVSSSSSTGESPGSLMP